MKKSKNNIPTIYAVWAAFILVASAIYIIIFKFMYQILPDWYVIFASPIVVIVALVPTLMYKFFKGGVVEK